MKHLDSKLRQLALFVALTSFFAATAATITSFPYTETNYSSNGWTYSNSNGKWTLYADYCDATISSGENNSWLFSPAINMTAGNIYSFTYTAENPKTRYPNSTVEFYILDDNDKYANQLKKFDTIVLSADEMKKTVTVEYAPENDGTVYFAVADKSNGSNGWYTYFNLLDELN